MSTYIKLIDALAPAVHHSGWPIALTDPAQEAASAPLTLADTVTLITSASEAATPTSEAVTPVTPTLETVTPATLTPMDHPNNDNNLGLEINTQNIGVFDLNNPIIHTPENFNPINTGNEPTPDPTPNHIILTPENCFAAVTAAFPGAPGPGMFNHQQPYVAQLNPIDDDLEFTNDFVGSTP